LADRLRHFSLPVLAEHGRNVMGLSGPLTDGMPSVTGTFEGLPLFGKTTISVYEHGRVVQTGCASSQQAVLSAWAHARAMSATFGLSLQVIGFITVNIVAKVELGRPVPLDILSKVLGTRCTFEDPQLAKQLHGRKEYSGARVPSALRRSKKPAKMIIFATGNAVLMGSRCRKDILFMMNEIDGFCKMIDTYISERSLSLVQRSAQLHAQATSVQAVIRQAHQSLRLQQPLARQRAGKIMRLDSAATR
jgi:TATA-box binding protein (TBP) (component of TFIID and TFIIIB)